MRFMCMCDHVCPIICVIAAWSSAMRPVCFAPSYRYGGRVCAHGNKGCPGHWVPCLLKRNGAMTCWTRLVSLPMRHRCLPRGVDGARGTSAGFSLERNGSAPCAAARCLCFEIKHAPCWNIRSMSLQHKRFTPAVNMPRRVCHLTYTAG